MECGKLGEIMVADYEEEDEKESRIIKKKKKG